MSKPAFEKAYGREPLRMMKALAWRGSEAEAETEVVRERLRALREEAERAVGHALDWNEPIPQKNKTTWRDRAAGFGCFLFAIAIVGIFALGVVKLIELLFGSA